MLDTRDVLTVQEALKSPYLESAIIVAGKNGLDKTVKWAHILEITQCKDYVNGQELILTTGAGWKNKDDPAYFIKQLIENDVTALCIQLGEKFNDFKSIRDIPSEIIEEADAHDFPLITIPENYDCRYVDLMHSLHTMIINKDYNVYLEQEKFLANLQQVLTNPHDTTDILHYIYSSLDVNAAYIPVEGEAQFIPNISKTQQKRIKEYLYNTEEKSVISMQKGNLIIAFTHVNACSQNLGFLVVFSEKHVLSSFTFLVLDKCSIALAQDSLGNLYIEEKEKYNKAKWVSKWSAGMLSAQEIKQNIQAAEPYLSPSGVIACLVSHNSPYKKQINIKESMLKLTGMARKIFDKYGYTLFLHEDYQTVVYILVDSRDNNSWKHRLNKALKEIYELFSYGNLYNHHNNLRFYAGKKYDDLTQLKQSLETAKEVLYVNKKSNCADIYFHDNLHIYKIIIMLEKNGLIENFIQDYLGPIISSSPNLDQHLLKTLAALRDCQYNKKEAAEKLFITRQSIYQRINTLENLLGLDFMTSAEKRTCLEIALYGLEYLNSSIKDNQASN
ncbi:MAG: PucR family transcriptional regulator [Bacillota bacterium]